MLGQGEQRGSSILAAARRFLQEGTTLLRRAAVSGSARLGRAGVRPGEQSFRALAENATDAIVTIDVNDHIVYANPAAERLFGYPRDELLDLPFTRLIPERHRRGHRAGIQRYLATGERRLAWTGIELPGLRKDGSEVALEVTFGEYVLRGAHHFNGIMRDITDRKRGESEREELLERERAARGEAERRAREEAALREAAEAVSAKFEIADVIEQIARSALTATNADGSFVERLDRSRGEVEIVARAGERTPPAGSRAPYDGSYAQLVIETAQPLFVDPIARAERRLPEGLALDCDDCAVLVLPLGSAEEPIGALFLVRETKKWEFRPDEIARAHTFGKLAALAYRKLHLLEDSEHRRSELERVMESRARLLRGFSHDVKNPLGAADGFLQLLQDGVMGDLESQPLRSIERARKAIGSALALIDDLSELARVEAGQIEIKAAPIDLNELVREVTDEYSAAAEAGGIALHCDVAVNLPKIESDGTRIRQVLRNLISNAIKYTADGRVDVAARPADGRSDSNGSVAIEVRDTGAGIPADKRHLLFREFTRLDPDAADGAGLGLAISGRIAHALGGDIRVDSEFGEGSTFTLVLPAVKPDSTTGGADAA